MSLLASNVRRSSLVFWMALALLFMSGILLLAFSSEAVAEANWHVGVVARELGTELGIAFIVSCIVAVLFEIYRSQSHTFDGMKKVIDAILGEQISPEVWMELKDLIAAKECIRRGVRIRLEFARPDRLPAHQRVLNVEYEYQLHSLTSKGSKVAIRHELDYQHRNAELGIPKFRRVVIQCPSRTRSWSSEELQKFATKGVFFTEVRLKPRNKQPAVVRTERSEVVNFPGAYNLYTPEFMKDVSITVVGCPPEIVIEVIVRPLGKGQTMLRAGDTWSCDHLLLPGQGIEIKMELAQETLFEKAGSEREAQPISSSSR